MSRVAFLTVPATSMLPTRQQVYSPPSHPIRWGLDRDTKAMNFQWLSLLFKPSVVLLCLAVRLLSNDYVGKQVLTSVLGPHITLMEATHNAKTVRAHAIIPSFKYVQLAH